MKKFLRAADRTAEVVMTTCENHFGLFALVLWMIAWCAMIATAAAH